MGNEKSKVQLSKEEIQVLLEQDFFHSKRIITEKIYHSFAQLVNDLKSSDSFNRISFPEKTDLTSGKISKGENYLGLPFLILDFPRLFSQEKILAFRTMVWWGNFVSNTLIRSFHEEGEEKELSNLIFKLKKQGIFFCVNESPWLHHFGNENYVSLDKLSRKEMEDHLSKNNFLKVTRKIPVSQINRLREFSMESFGIFSKLI